MIIGDCIHNLRSAFDHLAVSLVLSNGQNSKTAIRKTEFPTASSKADFTTKNVRRASPAAITAIEKLEPYRGGAGELIWQINKLDVHDKHRLLIPVGLIHRGPIIKTKMDVPFKETPIVWPAFQLIADEPTRYEEGATLLHVLAAAKTSDQPSPDFEFSFDVQFGDGEIRSGEIVGKVLQDFISFTEKTVDGFQRQFFP